MVIKPAAFFLCLETSISLKIYHMDLLRDSAQAETLDGAICFLEGCYWSHSDCFPHRLPKTIISNHTWQVSLSCMVFYNISGILNYRVGLHDKTICMDNIQYADLHYNVHSLYGHMMAVATHSTLEVSRTEQRRLVSSKELE